jgi:hypothetical protein
MNKPAVGRGINSQILCFQVRVKKQENFELLQPSIEASHEKGTPGEPMRRGLDRGVPPDREPAIVLLLSGGGLPSLPQCDSQSGMIGLPMEHTGGTKETAQ